MRKIFFCLSILVCLVFTPIVAEAKETVVIPEDIQELCEKWGAEYDICPELLEAMCWTESRCNPSVGTTYKGLTQINQKYFAVPMELLGITDLYDASQNIQLCAYSLSEYFKQNDDVYYVLMCWNSGSTKAKKLFSQGLYTKYSVRVSELSYNLEREHDK